MAGVPAVLFLVTVELLAERCSVGVCVGVVDDDEEGEEGDAAAA